MQPIETFKLHGYLNFVSTEVGFVTPIFSIDSRLFIVECFEDNIVDLIPLPDHYNGTIIPVPKDGNYELRRGGPCYFAFKYFDRLYCGIGDDLAKILIQLLKSGPFPIASRISARKFVNKHLCLDVKTISVMIVDDHRLLRETWVYLINKEKKFTTVAEASDGRMAIELARATQPNIILMDINMSPISGFEATEKIKTISPTSKIIGISMHSQAAYAKKMIQLGAGGYLTKNSSRDELFYAMNNIYMGNNYICDEITERLVSEEQTDKEEPKTLTQREIDIIELIKEGMTPNEIARHLGLSMKTVEVYKSNICKKLKIKIGTQLVKYVNSRDFL